jgi:hypothetical protein
LQIRNCGNLATMRIRNDVFNPQLWQFRIADPQLWRISNDADPQLWRIRNEAKIVPGICRSKNRARLRRPGRTRLPTALILSYALIAMLPCVFLLYRVNHNL